MTAGIYNHNPHSKETRDKIGLSHKGRHYHTEVSKKKIGEAHKGVKSHKWKGDDAVKITNHKFVAKYKPKPEGCEFCGSKRRLNLANMKNHVYTKNLDEYKWLRYSCHKKMDMKCAFVVESGKLMIRMVCDNCYKEGFNVWKSKFIRRLKEKLFFEQNPENRNKIIDKLAGDKLVEGEEK